MACEYTKGPWIISRTYRTHNLPERYWETDVTSLSGYVAKAVGATEEESRANAVLMAASRELLEALKAVGSCLAVMGIVLPIHETMLASNAIAKAEGK